MKHRRIFLVLLALVLALSLLTASLVFAGPDQAESSGNAAEQGKEQAEKESDVQAPASGGAIEAVPAGWATIDNAGSGNLWRFSDEIGDGNQTTANGGTGSSIAADVPGTTNSTAWDTELWSPAIDLSASTAATLTYASQFQDFAANGEIWLDISTDGGANWTNLRNQTVDDPTGGTFEIENLTAYVGNSVILRWRFQASASTMWFWHVDNVTVSDNTGTLLFEDFSPPPAPDLSTSSKSATPANLFVGDNISYTIIISNSGNLTTSMTMMTDTIPAGTTYVSGSVTCSLGSCAYNAGGDYISWSGDIGINQQAVIDFAVMSTQAGPVTNNADVSDSTFGPLMLSASSSVWDTVNFFTDFEADNGGLIGDNEWEWGMPTPPTSPVAYSGSNLWGTDLDNDYDASTTSVLTFTVDLSGLAGSPAVSLNWWEWFMVENCCDELFVRGSSASVPSTVLYGSTTGGPTPDQEAHEGVWFNAGIDITQFAGELATFTFHMQPDGSVHDAGWYIDDLAIYSVNPPPVSVLLNKTVGTDPSACATSNSIVVGPNTDVTYCYEILNTGAVTLTLHDLSDTELGSILSGFAYTLTPGASVWLTTTANLTQTTVNTATWTAYNPGPTDVTTSIDTATVTVIPPEPLVCNGPAAMFEAGIPFDWTVVDDSAGGGILWTTTADTANCGIANLTNGSGEAACADSDNAGSGAPAYDTSLVSSPFDLTGYSLYGLNVAAYYRDIGASASDMFQIDVWDGSTWTNELTWNENHQPEDIFLDLSAYAGVTGAQVRFRYSGNTWDWYAQVDDVSLSCLPGTVDISLTKTVGTDPATCATDDTITVSGGTEVYYCYEVTNNGTITATVHDLDDDRLGNIFSGVAYDLAPGASIDTVALGLTINATINTTTTNTATWTAYNGLFSAIATDTATVNVRQPIAQLDTTSIDETISTGEMTDVIITMDNLGNDPLTWSVVEEGGTRQLGRDIGTAWETMAPMPSARVFGAVIADGSGYVYVIGGTSDAGALTPTDTVFRYDTATNTWATMAAMPAALDSIDGIVIKDKIYIPGGDTNGGDTYVYDIATDSWSTIAANGGYSGRAQYQVVAIGDNLYVLGGIAGAASTTEVWVLDTTTGTWTAGTPMQRTRTSFSAAAIDGQIYVAGGVAFPGFAPDMTAEKFDGSAWSFIASLPNGGGAYTRWSYNADGHGADGLWLAAGRRDAGWAVLNHAGYYNPDTDTWTDSPTIPTLSQGRVYMEGAVASDGYFYVIGGRDSAGAIVYDANERLMVGAPVAPCNPSDLPWLSVNPISGTVGAGGSEQIAVSLDATGLATGSYAGSLCFTTNDPASPLIRVPVNFEVVERANLQVAHLAPFATGAGTAVTITLNSTVALTNVVYGDSTPYLSLAADSYLVEIWPAGSMSPAISATVDLMPGMDYTAIATGDGVNQPLALLALADDNSAPAAGSFKLRLGHLAPFASGMATADIRLQDGTPVLTNVNYLDVAPYLELPAGEYDLKITTPGGADTLIDILPVTFADGDIVSAFAVGDGTNEPTGAYALPAGAAGFFLPIQTGYWLYLPAIFMP